MTTASDELACVEVVIPADDPDWLADFTRSLVEDRLVACGHNIAPIRAIYRWEGATQDDTQARFGLHTRAGLMPEIVPRADRDHGRVRLSLTAHPVACQKRGRQTRERRVDHACVAGPSVGDIGWEHVPGIASA